MKILLFFLVCICANSLFSQSIRPDQGYEFMDTKQTVCGELATVSRATNDKGEKFTLLNYCADVPNACFTGRIPDNLNVKLPADIKTYGGKNVCVTGLIHYWEDKPEIIISDINQIKLKTQ